MFLSGIKEEKRCNENKLNPIEHICKTSLKFISGKLQSFVVGWKQVLAG